ncbi:MAG: hypothetical protein H6585_15485 [Flavobacteriales bacterium]|nr:hypothetical protein [Flavobacteriales bacterium]MCB9449733.1 hypothetical protein [Flavobacteriales bacterium]
MKVLPPNWITEKWIDFEYKKYILLSYLQEVSANFDVNKLYPFLSHLMEHHKNLLRLREGRQQLEDSFPKELKGISVEHMRLMYDQIAADDDLLKEIREIISYSIPQFEYYLEEGKKIYDFLESHMQISPVGVVPLYPEEGYLILDDVGQKRKQVYEYRLTIIEQPDGKFRAVQTRYIAGYDHSLTHSFTSIKQDLIKVRTEMPNPATYAVESEFPVPVRETFLPMAKRLLVRYIYMKKDV